MPVSPARKIAFDVLRRVALHDAYASELLYTSIEPGISRADAALATELTLGVLRWQQLLDFLLERHLDRPAARLDPEILLALRMGLYQLRFLERVPAHAAVAESVELAKLARKRSAAGLVNAVLRRAAPDAKITTQQIAAMLSDNASPAERAAVLHSHPTWLVERWMRAFGAERTVALLEANNRAPRLTCAVLDPANVNHIADSLRAAGLDVTPGHWLRSALTLSGGNPTATEPFQSGQISIQDEASQMVAHLLDARPGETVLDVCAAPGGKSMLLARAVAGFSKEPSGKVSVGEAPGGKVIAADLHGHRVRSMREQFGRTNTANIQTMELDAAKPLPFTQQFDRILVDAPCSGTGTLARNPEIRWRLKREDLDSTHRLQTAILRNALACLAPGGRLVYSTCSLEPEENEDVIREALAAPLPGTGGSATGATFRIVSGEEVLAPHLRDGITASSLFDSSSFQKSPTEFTGTVFRTFPPESRTDGFFAVVLCR